MKELMKRSDGPAPRDTAIWVALLLLTGALGVALWGSWWAVPVFAVYGVLYGSAADSRWHEMGHGTAFKARLMYEVVYEFASFLMMRNSVVWRLPRGGKFCPPCRANFGTRIISSSKRFRMAQTSRHGPSRLHELAPFT